MAKKQNNQNVAQDASQTTQQDLQQHPPGIAERDVTLKEGLLGLGILAVICYGIYEGSKIYFSTVSFGADILPFMVLWNVILTFMVIFLYQKGFLKWLNGLWKIIH